MVVRRARAMPLDGDGAHDARQQPDEHEAQPAGRTSERAMATTGPPGTRPIVAAGRIAVGHGSGMVPEICGPSPGADRHSTVPPMAPRRSLMFT